MVARATCILATLAWASLVLLSPALAQPQSSELSNAGRVLIPHLGDTTSEIEPASFQDPRSRTAPTAGNPFTRPRLSSRAQKTQSNLFGTQVGSSLLSERRQALRGDLVSGRESRVRSTTDAGSLLGKSRSTQGVAIQKRTPIISDPRIRGGRVGQIQAAGSHWVPARMDLDTLLSKIDSRLVDEIAVIKGPYTSRLGPGFSFIDVQLLPSPRFTGGTGSSGSSALEYGTNGEQVLGRQTFETGSDDWGLRVGYVHRTGNDYKTGRRFGVPTGRIGDDLPPANRIPSSYKSRQFDVAFGADLTPDSSIEFSYLRLDQTDVEFPGLVFDINYLVTDAYEVTYVLEDQPMFDRFTIEGWYNRTHFEGDAQRSSKRRQIPVLDIFFDSAVTDVDQRSSGFTSSWTWDLSNQSELEIGMDLRVVARSLNDLETLNRSPGPDSTTNYPIRPSESINPGVFVEHVWRPDSQWKVIVGARGDTVATEARREIDGPEVTSLQNDIDPGDGQDFVLGAVFATSEYQVTRNWTATGAVGIAERPPTLTELYSLEPFIGSLQHGETALIGDPELDAPQTTQFDIGLHADYDAVRFGANGFYSWIRDYITYDSDIATLEFIETVFTNTDMATLAGGEVYGSVDLSAWVSLFGDLSYVEGRDRSRSKPNTIAARLRESHPEFRSGKADVDREPLPGIPPLETHVGVRFHDPSEEGRWGIELAARIVDNQDRVARTLLEGETAGFTTWNVRAYRQFGPQFLVTAGVENLTNKFYREHLDYRPGRGVFQPGTNVYFGSELTY